MKNVIRFEIQFRGGVPEVIPRLDGRYMLFDDHDKALDRYKSALMEIVSMADRFVMSGISANEMADIARNALKED